MSLVYKYSGNYPTHYDQRNNNVDSIAISNK